MAGRQKRRTSLGGFRINLFDDRGRFTKDYRNARFFSVVCDNKADSKRREFSPKAKSSLVKEADVGYAVATILYQRDRAAIRKQAKYVEETEKKRVAVNQRKEKYGGREEKFLKELEQISPKLRKGVIGEIAARRERRKIGTKQKKAPKELRGVSDRTLEERAFKIAGKLIQEGTSIFPDKESSAEELLSTFGVANLSTEGYRTKTEQVTNKNGKPVWRQVRGEDGNPFAIAQREGISEEEHLWSVMRNYLRELGYEHFNELCKQRRRKYIHLGVIVSTNILGFPPYYSSLSNMGTFIANLRENKKEGKSEETVRKEHMDRLCYQMVRATMQALNRSEAATAKEFSVLSSGKSLVLKLSKPSQRGHKSMKTKHIKIAFSLFSPWEA